MLRLTGTENNSERLINQYFKMNTIKLINKYQPGGEVKRTPSTLEYLIPVYGTYLSGKDFVEDPTWKNGVNLGLSVLGDVGTFFGVGAGLKALTKANKAFGLVGKSAKAASAAKRGKSSFAALQAAQSDYAKALAAYKANPNPTTKFYLDRAMGVVKSVETRVARATDAVGNLSEAGQKAIRAQHYVETFKPNRTVTAVVPD